MERKVLIHSPGRANNALTAFLAQAATSLGLLPGGAANKALAVRPGRPGPDTYAGRVKIAKAQDKRERRWARNQTNAMRERNAQLWYECRSEIGMDEAGVWFDEWDGKSPNITPWAVTPVTHPWAVLQRMRQFPRVSGRGGYSRHAL